MTSIALSRQQQKELDSLIEFINELVESLKSSKIAISDFLHNFNYCKQLRSQRKTFEKHTKMALAGFPNLSEKNQVNLELHYYKALKHLNKLLPSAEIEIRRDFNLIISSFLLREIKKTIKSITKAQQGMSSLIYQDNSQEILSNPELYNELVNNWADLENN